jgi:mannan endo-1,4-beta-mannosidase
LKQKRTALLLTALASVALACAGLLFMSEDVRRYLRSFASDSKPNAAPPGFVIADGTHFSIDGRPFRFVGANVAVMYGGEPEHMTETLDAAARDGVRVVRVWAHGEIDERDSQASIAGSGNAWLRANPFRRAPHVWNEAAFLHLDRVLVEAARRRLRVQLCLSNWWPDTGGVTQYLAWAGIRDAFDRQHPHNVNTERAMLFYTNEETRRLYRQHVEKIVARRNTLTGKLYRDDPTIFGYELMNEAQAPTGRDHERRAWVAEMSAYLKSLDPNHLVTPGLWGYRNSRERREWLETHRLPTIDYCDVHVYPRDDLDSYVDSTEALRYFIDNRAAAAFSIDKPLVVGEFGIPREGFRSHSQADWFRAYFDLAGRAHLGGAMFWILTREAERDYGISYTTPRDDATRAELKRASTLFTSFDDPAPPSDLLDFGRHLIPRQFAFARSPDDPAALPRLRTEGEAAPLVYSFAPEQAARGRFEKLGGGAGYVWGDGVGYFEYLLPARDFKRSFDEILVRAYLQPTIPPDARSRFDSTRVTLYVNDTDCGSRLVRLAPKPQAPIQEWRIDSLPLRTRAALGQALSIRFAVQLDADHPFGLTISNFPEGHDARGASPVEVELK